MRVFEAAAETIRRLGVDSVFGVMGHGNVRIITHLTEACGVRYLAARQETSAVSMADGYARVSGRVGLCTVTEGPGITNAITGLTEAAKGHTSLLLLAGDSPAVRLRDNQHVDIGAVVVALGIPARRLDDGATFAASLAASYHQALSEQTPVVAIVPQDTQMEELPEAPDWDAIIATPDKRRQAPDAKAIADAADILIRAKQPVILAGRGALRSGAELALQRLGEQTGALMATSAQTKGLFARDPYYAGISGGFSSPVAVELLREADLVLVFGSSLTAWTTRAGSLMPRASVVQCDVRQEAVATGRTSLVGDAAATAEALAAELERRGFHGPGYRSAEVARRIAEYRPGCDLQDQSTGGRVDPRVLMARLDGILPAQRTVALDSGMFLGLPAIYLTPPDAAGFVFSQDFQAMGLGLGLALGAAIARPDRLPVAVVGDGGLMMSLGEIETAARLGIPLLTLVINDAAYGAEIRLLESIGKPIDHALFTDVDFAGIARGMGAQGITVRSLAELEGLTSWLDRRDGPMLVDCKVMRGIRAEWFEEALTWMGR